jgi:hypothetical protein
MLLCGIGKVPEMARRRQTSAEVPGDAGRR